MLLKLFKPIDDLIDGLSMYRLLLYYLLALVAAAVGLSLAGDLHYSAVQIAATAGIAVLACWLINKIFAYIFNAPANPESSILTGLIIALIIPPILQGYGIFFILAASGLAIASKYVINIGGKHIFNPAAIAVVLTALGAHQNASWWVGTAAMLPFVLIGGVLIARKVRREHMVITFLAVTTITTAVLAMTGKSNVPASLHNLIASSPAFFLGFVMLTEPYSSPTTRRKQLWYAAIVGFLIAPQVHVGSYYTTPEVGLIIGNLFAYIVSTKTKLFPALRQRTQVAARTIEFAFVADKPLTYEPGQYMEFTLPHEHADSRGSRRWFTLASSPTENLLKIGVKFYKEGSSYKNAMLTMDQNTPIVAAQVAGDFVLPKDRTKKLVFIAGGIGVTPFRSMTKYLIDINQTRSVTMLYGASSEDDLAYQDIFEAARQKFGMQVHYVLSKPSRPTGKDTVVGRINNEMIKKYVPDYQQCIFYISGTHSMVEAMQLALKDLGISRKQIKTDFFPGYS